MTFALGGSMFLSASMAFSARYSWTNAKIAFTRMTMMIATPRAAWSEANARTVATHSRMANMFTRCAPNRIHIGFGFLAVSTFSPNSASRFSASSCERPLRDVPSSSYAFSAGRPHSAVGSTCSSSGDSTSSSPLPLEARRHRACVLDSAPVERVLQSPHSGAARGDVRSVSPRGLHVAVAAPERKHTGCDHDRSEENK